MNNTLHQRSANELSGAWRVTLPFVSGILGAGAVWIAWFRYNALLNQPASDWYSWIQLVVISLIGILCLSATALSILGKRVAWTVLKAGLSLIPMLLFTNLVILLMKVIQNISQGNANFLFERLTSQPQKLIIIAIIVIILSLLGSLSKIHENHK